MATSGTTGFTADVQTLIEEAYERCGLELRTGYELRTAVRSLNFLFLEWANRGLNLWTVEPITLTLVPGQLSYDLPQDTVDVIDAVVRAPSTTASDIRLERISVSSYAQIPNKFTQGLPIQFHILRGADHPTLKLWQVPDQAYVFTYWRLRRIQDAGSVVNTTDIPFRFVPALVAGLAYHVALKKGAACKDRIPLLKDAYEEAFQLAADEDRDRASLMFTPDVGWG